MRSFEFLEDVGQLKDYHVLNNGKDVYITLAPVNNVSDIKGTKLPYAHIDLNFVWDEGTDEEFVHPTLDMIEVPSRMRFKGYATKLIIAILDYLKLNNINSLAFANYERRFWDSIKKKFPKNVSFVKGTNKRFGYLGISKITEEIAPETQRLEVKTTSTGKRTFFEGYLKADADETPAWLRVVQKPKLVVEATCELDAGGDCYIGHIQAHQEYKGFATEIVKYILDYYRDQGVNNFKAYINHSNLGSKNVFRKLGFAETNQQRDGSVWTLTL
jgi:GNAT superfamily N-acetyltransferase